MEICLKIKIDTFDFDIYNLVVLEGNSQNQIETYPIEVLSQALADFLRNTHVANQNRERLSKVKIFKLSKRWKYGREFAAVDVAIAEGWADADGAGAGGSRQHAGDALGEWH